jgi:CRP-like cAMP-binding protein
MVANWLSRPGQPPSVEALVAEGEYGLAVTALQAEMQGRPPTHGERLRLADLLVLADRGTEALPLLLHVADDMERYGFRERALEALRRAHAVAPNHPDVRDRFERLARSARARVAAAQAATRHAEEKTDPYLPTAMGGGSHHPPAPAPHEGVPLEEDRELLAFVRRLGDGRPGKDGETLATALFSELQHYIFRRTAEGLHRRQLPAGGIVVSEGDPGTSAFLIASGSVRILVVGGHGRPLEIRRLHAGDFFGELAALSGRPRTATVVADEGCELLEVERWALERLVEARPAARAILDGAREGREQSPEESAVRALPEEASPERAAAVLAAHFGGSEWSPRVRLHFAKLMLEAGLEGDALAVIASVAEDLDRAGQPETAIAILKRVDQARRRNEQGATHRTSRAASDAAFRLWVGSLAHGADALSAPVERAASAAGEPSR